MIFIGTFVRVGPKGKKTLVKRKVANKLIPHKPQRVPNEQYAKMWGYQEKTLKSIPFQVDKKIVLPIIDKIERELNAGFSAWEAESAFPRIGQHNRPIYYVHLMNNDKISI